MEYMDLWNKIVEYFEDNRNSEEKIIQHDWEKLFREFGYEKTEIDSQRSIQLGSTERGKPDIILRNGTEDLFVVELKRHTLHDGKEQLFSYLNQLKMNLGIVVCDNLYLYDYDFTQKNCYSKVEIPFEKENLDGAKFVELFSKNNFNKQKISDFIKSKCNSQSNIAKIKSEISSELIKDLLKKHFKAEYSVSDEDFEEAYSEMNISVGTQNINFAQTLSHVTKTIPPVVKSNGKTSVIIKGVTIPLYRTSNQSVQDFIKQTLHILLGNNLLSADEILNLQDFSYCKRTFNLQFPLFVKNVQDTSDNKNHSRYWSQKIVGFYVCSQWWKQLFTTYDDKIAEWLLKLEAL